MKAVLLLVLLIAGCADARKLLETVPSPSPAGNATYWPPDWDVPVSLMSRGDLLARGGAMRALGRDKLNRIKEKASVGVSVETLATVMDSDGDLWLHPEAEKLLQRCNKLAHAQPADGQQAAAPDSAAGLWTLDGVPIEAAGLMESEVFNLHSRPGAKKKLVLDFDGATVSDTYWNYDELPTITAPAWDTDKNPSSFSTEELAQIKAIWRKVAENFAVFDIDVTTQDPGEQAIIGTGLRAVIGGDGSYLPGFKGAGGACWVGSFGTKTPCFIFQKALYSDLKVVADAISHEFGHGLGLLHDGTDSSNGKWEYYSGQGNWGTIMGLAYTKNITQWNNGDYLGANNQQDDFKVMSSFVDILPPQFGSSIQSATQMPASDSVQGIITQQGQADYFAFTAKAGGITITVAGPGTITTSMGKSWPIGSMDMQLVLYNSAGAVLQSSNPAGASAEALGASIQTNLPADGTYFVSVSGVGAGDPKATGYSSYGSRGSYFLTATYLKPSGDGGGPVGNTDPIDCLGSWSEWGLCTSACTQTSQYHITSQQQGTGKPCEAIEGQVRSRACSSKTCVPVTSPSPSPKPQLPSPSPSPSPQQPGTVQVAMPQIEVRREIVNLSKKRYKCKATAAIVSVTGKRLAKATVSGQWELPKNAQRIVKRKVEVPTSDAGFMRSTSAVVTGAHGSCKFVITDIALTGYYYNSAVSGSEGSLEW